jgi:arginyl-tRNA synthetase
MGIIQHIQRAVSTGLSQLFDESFSQTDFQINQTKAEFEGDYTVVLFALVKKLKRSPEVLGKELGSHLTTEYPQYFRPTTSSRGFLISQFRANIGLTCYRTSTTIPALAGGLTKDRKLW